MFCTIGSDGKGNIKHLFMCMCVYVCVCVHVHVRRMCLREC